MGTNIVVWVQLELTGDRPLKIEFLAVSVVVLHFTFTLLYDHFERKLSPPINTVPT